MSGYNSAIIRFMILVTGATGFLGTAVVERLLNINNPTRLLIRPKKESPNLIHGIPLDISVAALDDPRGLRAAMKNVKTIFHFATAEQEWPEVDLEEVDVNGTENIILSAREAGVKKILFFSRVGADKNSSYPVLRSKSLCEELIIQSGLSYTIIRLTDIYGKNDHFTNTIASSLKYSPGFYPLPGGGKTLLQPLWLEDILAIITLIMEKDFFDNRVIEIGGGEYFNFSTIVKLISEKINKKRIFLSISSAYLRILNLWVKPYKKSFPLATLWLDLLAVNRICSLDSMSRSFNMLPVRFSTHLDHF